MRREVPDQQQKGQKKERKRAGLRREKCFDVGTTAAAIGAVAAAAAIIFQICVFYYERAQRINGEIALLQVLMKRVDKDLSTRAGQDLLSKSQSDLQADKRSFRWASAEQRLYEELVNVVRQKDRIGNESLLLDLAEKLEGESSQPMMSVSDVFKIRSAIKRNEEALQRDAPFPINQPVTKSPL